MFPSATPEACTWPLSGCAALWMKSVCGCATPFGPPSIPPPATSTGSHGLAVALFSVNGSRPPPLGADPPPGHEHRVPRLGGGHLVRERVAPPPPGRPTAQAAPAADPRDPVLIDVDVVGVVGQSVVAPEVDRLGIGLRVSRVLEVRDPDRAAVPAAAGREGAEISLVVTPRRPPGPHVVAALDAAPGGPAGQLTQPP